MEVELGSVTYVASEYSAVEDGGGGGGSEG